MGEDKNLKDKEGREKGVVLSLFLSLPLLSAPRDAPQLAPGRSVSLITRTNTHALQWNLGYKSKSGLKNFDVELRVT